MFCSKCGKQLPNDAKFCFNCGAPINIPEPEEKTEIPEPITETPVAETPVVEEAPVVEETVVEETPVTQTDFVEAQDGGLDFSSMLDDSMLE